MNQTYTQINTTQRLLFRLLLPVLFVVTLLEVATFVAGFNFASIVFIWLLFVYGVLDAQYVLRLIGLTPGFTLDRETLIQNSDKFLKTTKTDVQAFALDGRLKYPLYYLAVWLTLPTFVVGVAIGPFALGISVIAIPLAFVVFSLMMIIFVCWEIFP